jgi:hypothetical protein
LFSLFVCLFFVSLFVKCLQILWNNLDIVL